jgi:hypothetical protein
MRFSTDPDIPAIKDEEDELLNISHQTIEKFISHWAKVINYC